MAITDSAINLFHVDARLELYDEMQALLQDHLLDHLQLLALISDCAAIPDTTTHAHLAAHDRYRNLLDGSRQSTDRLLKLFHAESQFLLAGIPRVARPPRRKRAALYSSLRELVPYVGYRGRPYKDR